MEQSLQQIRAPLVADAEATTAEQPGERALDHPPAPTEPLARVTPTAGKTGRDAAKSQSPAQRRGIVGLVRVQLGRALPWPPRLPAPTDDRRDGVDQRHQLGRIVGVGGREADGQGDAVPVDDQVVLGTGFAPIDRVRPGLLAPLLARTLMLSRLARDQSMAPASPSQFSSVACRRSQTPASCQSRSRRQHVMPLPQPSSWGSISHGMPLLRTKTMPVRQARSGTRGRPPFGLAGPGGSNGSTIAQSSSDTNGLLMPRQAASPVPRFC